MCDCVFQLNCWFGGNVQGVGFRYQTVVVAKGFEVTGFVTNLSDGRVHLYVEGKESEVLKFQSELETELDSHIREKEINMSTGRRSSVNFLIKD